MQAPTELYFQHKQTYELRSEGIYVYCMEFDCEGDTVLGDTTPKEIGLKLGYFSGPEYFRGGYNFTMPDDDDVHGTGASGSMSAGGAGPGKGSARGDTSLCDIPEELRHLQVNGHDTKAG